MAVCILINCAGRMAAQELSLPLWLDSIGTAFAAYVGGPLFGTAAGAAVNIIAGFSNPASYAYGVTSAGVGLIIGICAREGMFRHLFGAMTTGFLVTVTTVAVATPLNCLYYEGMTGNMWGDGVIGLFQEWGFGEVISYVIGEFSVDFLDKTLTTMLLFSIVCLLRFFRRRKSAGDGKRSGKSSSDSNGGKRAAASALAVLLVGGFLLNAMPVRAEENEGTEFGSQIQTIYNNANGLPGGIANDIAKTENGVLWIGTYNGLYRYSGGKFEQPAEFSSLVNVKCLYTDEENRLWIGTNDNGMALCINGKMTAVLDEEQGLPSASVRCISGGQGGIYYAGTADSLAIVSIAGGAHVVGTIDEITYGDSISVRNDGLVAVVTNAGTLYIVRDGKVLYSHSSQRQGRAFTCCRFSEDGSLLVGTTENEVEIFHIGENALGDAGTLSCGNLVNIKSINFSERDGVYATEGQGMYVCADNGAGFFSADRRYTAVDTGRFNSSLDHCLIDYQGDVWFTSSRMGLLKLSPSALTDIYQRAGLEEQVVNSTIKWNDIFYYATDDGLDAADKTNTKPVENSLTRALDGIRVRSLMVDSLNRLWISTTGSGVWCVRGLDDIDVFDSRNGMPGDKFRTVLETSDGGIVVAGDQGVAFLRDDKVEKVITSEQGLRTPRILCLAEIEPGLIYAGTDGNGIAVIENQQLQRHISREDGLSSEIILRIVQMEDRKNLLIVTGNGLCRMNTDADRIWSLTNFPYRNNYDAVEYDGKLFVLSSAGVYVVGRDSLFRGSQVEYALLSSSEGLKNVLTPNSRNYLDENNNLFMSTDLGVVCLNLDKYDNYSSPYRIRLKDLKVDDVTYEAERGGRVIIPRNSVRLEVTPEIVDFSPSDPLVSIYLEGFDKEERIVRQSQLTNIVYTNLPSKEYTLYLKVLNEKGRAVASTKYTFAKEKAIFDNRWFLMYVLAVFSLALVYLSWLIVRTQLHRQFKLHQKEIELVNRQIKMSNEAIIAIARTVDAKDKNTSLHSQRVAQYSVMIAERLGFDEEQREELRRTALLHDIGKIGVADQILNKPSRLDDEEYSIMKRHVVVGAEILHDFTTVKNVVEGALYHHERYDGRGYVNGLKGEEIPLNARIIGIADAFDAMTANRVYRKKLDFDYVLSEIEKGRGTQFDPELVDIMLELVRDGSINPEELYKEEEE